MIIRYIYKVTYKPTNQFYIGKRKARENCSPEEDFGIYYFTSAKTNSWIKKSLKNNRELWIVEFLHVDAKTDEELAEQEFEELSKYFDGTKKVNELCLNENNSKNFDFSGHIHSEESKRKIGESQVGNKNHFYGKHHSDETKKIIGEKQKGRMKSEAERKHHSELMKINNPMKNPANKNIHKMAVNKPEYIEKKKIQTAGKNNPNYGNYWSEEQKRALSEKLKEVWKRKKEK